MTDIRALTVDELDRVAGGADPATIFVGFVVGYLATKLADDVAPAFKVVDDIKGLIDNKEKGK